jgi:hypothetical protein
VKGTHLCVSVLQIPLRPPQQIKFRFQLADDHPILIQFDPLQAFHTLFQAKLQSLKHLDWGQLCLSRHEAIIFAFSSP